MRHRTLALTGLLSLCLAACGGTNTSPSAASPSAPASVAPGTHAPSSPAPSGSSAAVSSAEPSGVPHGAPQLERSLPRAFRGQPLFLLSFGATELAASQAKDSFDAIIVTAGGDVTKAGFAVANDSATTQGGTFNAFAVSGAGGDGTKLVAAYVASAITVGESESSSTTTLGGKAGTRIKSSDTTVGDSWVYAIDDIIYGVQAKDEALAAEPIALLS